MLLFQPCPSRPLLVSHVFCSTLSQRIDPMKPRHSSTLCVCCWRLRYLKTGRVKVMLLRCIQASSFEDEWTALSAHHLKTGFKQSNVAGPIGRWKSWMWPHRPSVMYMSSCMLAPFVYLVPFYLLSHQKCFTGRLASTLLRWRRQCVGAPRRTYLGRLRVTQTSLLHFMTLSPAETTHSASPKVCNVVGYPAIIQNNITLFRWHGTAGKPNSCCNWYWLMVIVSGCVQ